MALPLGNTERGLSKESGVSAGSGRGTENRGIPSIAGFSWSPDRYITYRLEDTARGPKSGRVGYPLRVRIPFYKGQSAPDSYAVSPGIVAYRAEPDWQRAPEAPRTPPPLIEVHRPHPPSHPQGHKLSKSEAEPAEPSPVTKPSPVTVTKAPPDFVGDSDEDNARRERVRAIRDHTDATLGKGFEWAAKVAKVASLIIPGPAGRIFKGAETGLQGAHDAYEAAKLVEELVVEMDQSDALGKGSKELLKKGEEAFTKAADPILDKILKKKGISLPEQVRKQTIKKVLEYFDKHVRDPAIEKGTKEFKRHLDPKERDKSLWDEWSRGLGRNGTDLPILR